MSGIEVLSFIASIAQLARYVNNIKEFIQEIYGQVQSGPQGLEQRLDQLDRVLDTVRQIEQNSLFHTPSIGRHLEAIVVQVESLQAVFGRLRTRKPQTTWRKYWNAYTETRAEKQIFVIFAKLEEEKGTLQLSMTEVNGTLLSRTNSDLAQSSSTIQHTHGDVQEVLSRSAGMTRRLENLSKRLPMLTREVDAMHCSRGTSQNQVEVEEHRINATNGASARAQEGHVPIREVDCLQDVEPQWSSEAASRVHRGTGILVTLETLESAASLATSANPPIPPQFESHTPLLNDGNSALSLEQEHRSLPFVSPSTPSVASSLMSSFHPRSSSAARTPSVSIPSIPSPSTSSSSRTSHLTSSTQSGHCYIENISSTDASQLNGDLGACDRGSRHHRHEHNKATNGGRQINGNMELDGRFARSFWRGRDV
ncbi:hypothetical protein MMC22_001152 [Lobaria immixta]|nr:hypothetical protein [Lobaria immixta]